MATAVQFTKRLARTAVFDPSDRLVRIAALLSAVLIAAAAILKPGIFLVIANILKLAAIGLGLIIAVTIAAIILAYLAGLLVTIVMLAMPIAPRSRRS